MDDDSGLAIGFSDVETAQIFGLEFTPPPFNDWKSSVRRHEGGAT